MAGSPQERVLAAELLVVMGVQTADALSGAYTGKFQFPNPSRYFASIVVYLMLAAAAMFGEKPARLAATFGGVAALTILLAPTKRSVEAGKPEAVAVSAIGYLAQLVSGGSLAAPNNPTPTAPAATAPPTGGNISPGSSVPKGGYTPGTAGQSPSGGGEKSTTTPTGLGG